MVTEAELDTTPCVISQPRHEATEPPKQITIIIPKIVKNNTALFSEKKSEQLIWKS
jgi:hypothetical protein